MWEACKGGARLFIQRFWQPTTACMTCMPGSWGNVWSLTHWTIALQTGIITGLLAVLLSLTPARALYHSHVGNALVVGFLAVVADVFSHPSHFGGEFGEPLLTGAVAFLLALVVGSLFEDRARRMRVAWSTLTRQRD